MSLVSDDYEDGEGYRQPVPVLRRSDFLDEFEDDYEDGQHVSIFGPTGRGKSRLCYQMLQRVISPDRQVTSLHGKIKGRDPVIAQAAKQCHLRIVTELPSNARRVFDRRRKWNGYILVPLEKPGRNTEEENEKLYAAYQEAIHDNYSNTRRPTITHINEAHQTQQDLGLRRDIEAPLMRGGPDNAVWHEGQRGAYLSYHTYNAPEHLLVFYDDDATNRRRYADFGCADPDEIQHLTSRLKTERSSDGRTISQALYIRRGGGMYVVDT